MGKQDEADVRAMAKGDPSQASFEDDEQNQPPSYDKAVGSMSMAPTFPSAMNGYYRWNPPAMRTFDLCGASRDERLCAVEIHTGYSRKGPLGTRPGVILHNGTSNKDSILAAAGDESQWDARIYAFNSKSVVLLPPVQPQSSTSSMVTEMMRGSTTSDNNVAFHFYIEVDSDAKTRREKFEWRKAKKGDDDTKESGFKLVRLSPGANNNKTQSSSSIGTNSEELTGLSVSSPPDGETVAVLEWKTGLGNVMSAFSLQLAGSGQFNELGERWTLMAVITALRIWSLHVNGRTKRGVVRMGEKTRSG